MSQQDNTKHYEGVEIIDSECSTFAAGLSD